MQREMPDQPIGGRSSGRTGGAEVASSTKFDSVER
jgi:hypothetical protein